MIVVGAGTVALVILGALILDGGTSGGPKDGGLTAGNAETTTGRSGNDAGGTAPGPNESGAASTSTDPTEDTRQFCLLLPPSIANSILDPGWEPSDEPMVSSNGGGGASFAPGCVLDRLRGDDVGLRAELSLFELEADQTDSFKALEPRGDPAHLGDRRYRVDSALHEESVPSLPEGRVVWCGCAAPTEDMHVEWVVDGYTWQLSLELRYRNLGLYGERPGIAGQRDAMIAAAQEIHGLILQGVHLE